MAIIKWVIKELISSIKLNNFGLRRATTAEQAAILDTERLAGDLWHNSTDLALEMYQSGSGSTFDVTELSNFIFRSDVPIGVSTVEQTIYDEEINNMRGISNTRVYVNLDYLPEVSVAGDVNVTVTDGSSPVTVTDSFSSDPTPVIVFKRFVINTSSFSQEDILNIVIKATNCVVDHVEARCI